MRPVWTVSVILREVLEIEGPGEIRSQGRHTLLGEPGHDGI